MSKLRHSLILLILNMWEKAALHVWFICVTIFSWLSNQPPRFLTSEEGRIALWPTQRESMSTFTNCYLVPITVNSVFSSLSISLCKIVTLGQKLKMQKNMLKMFLQHIALQLFYAKNSTKKKGNTQNMRPF